VGPDVNFRHFATLVTTFAGGAPARSPADPYGTALSLTELRCEKFAWVQSLWECTCTVSA